MSAWTYLLLVAFPLFPLIVGLWEEMRLRREFPTRRIVIVINYDEVTKMWNCVDDTSKTVVFSHPNKQVVECWLDSFYLF